MIFIERNVYDCIECFFHVFPAILRSNKCLDMSNTMHIAWKRPHLDTLWYTYVQVFEYIFENICYTYWVVIMDSIPYVQRNLDFIFSRYLWFTCQVILHDYFYRIWEDYLLLSAMHYATINLIVFKGRKYYSACVVIFHDTFWPLISVLYFICDTCIWTTFQRKHFLG